MVKDVLKTVMLTFRDMQATGFTNGRIAHDTLLVARKLKVPPKRILECFRLYRTKLSTNEQEDIYSIGGTLGRPIDRQSRSEFPRHESLYKVDSKIAAAIEAKDYLSALVLSLNLRNPKAFLAATVGLKQPLLFDPEDLGAMTEGSTKCHLGYIQFRDKPALEVVVFGVVGEATKIFEDRGAYPTRTIRLKLNTTAMPAGRMRVSPFGCLPKDYHIVPDERELTDLRFEHFAPGDIFSPSMGSMLSLKIRFMSVDWPKLSG
ncbi:MAG: hypothetical protein Q7S22_08310 [Candidatus Micrarchaeota archaeon]|nr:hypothetical protein [Candidatus Micrarchaeota archaeon]